MSKAKEDLMRSELKVKLKKGSVVVEQIRFRAGITMQTRPYENAKFDAEIAVRPEGDISLEDASNFAWDYVRSQVGQNIKSIRAKLEGSE